MTRLTFTAKEVSGRSIIRPEGEIDLESSSSLESFLQQFTGAVVVDLATVTFVDSSGLAVFIRQQKRLNASGGDLRLRAPTPEVRHVFEVTGLHDLLGDNR